MCPRSMSYVALVRSSLAWDGMTSCICTHWRNS